MQFYLFASSCRYVRTIEKWCVFPSQLHFMDQNITRMLKAVYSKMLLFHSEQMTIVYSIILQRIYSQHTFTNVHMWYLIQLINICFSICCTLTCTIHISYHFLFLHSWLVIILYVHTFWLAKHVLQLFPCCTCMAPQNLVCVWLNVFNAKWSPKRQWRGLRSQEVGQKETKPNTVYTVTTTMTPALRWAVMKASLRFH